MEYSLYRVLSGDYYNSIMTPEYAQSSKLCTGHVPKYSGEPLSTTNDAIFA